MEDILLIELPPTAVEAVTVILAFLVSVFSIGHLTNILADMVKRWDDWLKSRFGKEILDAEQERRVGGLIAEVAVLLIAAGLSFLATQYLNPLAQYFDGIGAWPVIVSAWGFARQIFVQRKRAGL